MLDEQLNYSSSIVVAISVVLVWLSEI